MKFSEALIRSQTVRISNPYTFRWVVWSGEKDLFNVYEKLPGKRGVTCVGDRVSEEQASLLLLNAEQDP